MATRKKQSKVPETITSAAARLESGAGGARRAAAGEEG